MDAPTHMLMSPIRLAELGHWSYPYCKGEWRRQPHEIHRRPFLQRRRHNLQPTHPSLRPFIEHLVFILHEILFLHRKSQSYLLPRRLSLLSFLTNNNLGSASGYLGLVNASELTRNKFVAVKFLEGDANHVGLDLDSTMSIKTGDAILEEIDLKSGSLITAWIEYRSDKRNLNVGVRERDNDVDGKNTPAVADGGSISCSEEARWAGATK
ncbi:putative L-type lectin-domain containing receptor kinase S.7 [Senna tora]|uniref:Putative L-type lectin-domain containing receptor kinase S.7 n=1 Tax=Senna tora TaxID=362788 RepID=A0A834T7D5_9FABA|nr:putative L-type lectin-domain containing receptor kinase S.7 [Senna tora]